MMHLTAVTLIAVAMVYCAGALTTTRHWPWAVLPLLLAGALLNAEMAA